MTLQAGTRLSPYEVIRVDPRLDPVRADPRYADLLQRVGFKS